MNERIKELASQVGAKPIYYEFLTGYEIPGKDGLEKFAELIIQECENALHPMLRDMISREHAYNLIKKRFGVE